MTYFLEEKKKAYFYVGWPLITMIKAKHLILRFVSQGIAQGYRSINNKVECSLGNLESLHATFEEKYGKRRGVFRD